jgi:hypothetical protein
MFNVGDIGGFRVLYATLYRIARQPDPKGGWLGDAGLQPPRLATARLHPFALLILLEQFRGQNY